MFMSFCHCCELDLTLKSLYLSESESCLLEVGTEEMARNLILKPALGIFLKFKIYPKKGMGEGKWEGNGRETGNSKLPFHFRIF